MLCSNCNQYGVYNQHFKLCIFCNKKRLDENKKTSRTGAECSTGPIRTNEHKKKTRKPIRTRTKKSIGQASQRAEFREKVFAQRDPICTGCKGTDTLTVSHTIPVSLRKDLEFELDNVHVECMVCHQIWEHGTAEQKQQLLSFQQKIDYIKQVDKYYYERRFSKPQTNCT